MERFDPHHSVAYCRGHAKSLRIPGNVTAERTHRESLPEPIAEFLRVRKHDLEHLGKTGRISGLSAIENIREISEQPWTAQAAAADNNGITSGGTHHSKRVLPFPYVSVAQNRNLHGLFQFCDRIPICVAIVELCGRAGMQAYRSTSFFFSNTACS